VDSGGRATAVKAWTSNLTEAEHLAESTQKSPIITSNLFTYLSCNVGSTIGNDDGPDNHDWTTVGAGLSLVAEEPFFMPPRRALLGVGY
jgi:hypothetical protein